MSIEGSKRVKSSLPKPWIPNVIIKGLWLENKDNNKDIKLVDKSNDVRLEDEIESKDKDLRLHFKGQGLKAHRDVQ